MCICGVGEGGATLVKEFFPLRAVPMIKEENNFMSYILRTVEGFEKCSQNEGRVGYLPLESNISN